MGRDPAARSILTVDCAPNYFTQYGRWLLVALVPLLALGGGLFVPAGARPGGAADVVHPGRAGGVYLLAIGAGTWLRFSTELAEATTSETQLDARQGMNLVEAQPLTMAPIDSLRVE